MYETQRLVLPLSAHAITSYQPLIPSELQCCLLDQPPIPYTRNKLIVIAAYSEKNPIGIAIGSCGLSEAPNMLGALINRDSPHSQAIVHHVFVVPEHRNQHIGRSLLSHLQKELLNEGARYITLTYASGEVDSLATEKMLAACKWEGPRPFMLRCLYHGPSFDMPWVHEDRPYPPGFVEFEWKEITPKEKEELIHRQKQNIYTESVSPFADEAHIEPLNSLGLRYQGRIVGWMITHRINPNTIRYSALYIEKGLQFHKLAPKLIFSSIRRHMEKRTEWALLEIPLIQVKGTWKRFVECRLAPYANKVTKFVQCWYVHFPSTSKL